MRTFNYKIQYLFLIAAAVFFSWSCEDNGEEAAGNPSLTKVSPIKDDAVSISSGNMGDWISITGKNLESVQAIRFNDVDVDMKEVYYENNVLHLQIPVKMPLEVTNKLTVITRGGESSFDFTVNVPNLELTGMFNEYTLPGDTIKIYGKFLDLYEITSENTKIVFGNIESPVIDNNSNYLTARVPQNVQANVKVKAVNSKFNATAECPGWYQDKHNIVTTFDDDFPYTNGTGQQWVAAWPDPKPTSGKYIRFEVTPETYSNGLGWFYLMEHNVNYQIDMLSHPENYVLKFELNMLNPIQRTKFFIYFYWAIDPNPIGSEYFSVQNPGVWQTVTIPLDKIVLKDKWAASPYPWDGVSTGFSINFRVENFAPVERVAMYFDNLRIYKVDD
ncbi:MAG: glycan-binding surface protein [Dysgonamonadaceae bacterium]|nr:glycan-binding surface protein [Dysgonamonadaceae bacterium]